MPALLLLDPLRLRNWAKRTLPFPFHLPHPGQGLNLGPETPD